MGGYDPKAVSDYEPEVALEKAWYTFKIQSIREANAKNGNAMIFVDMVCVSGPKQSTGKKPDGQEATYMLMLEYEGMKAQGKNLCQKRLSEFINACDLDPKKKHPWEDFEGVEIEALAEPGEYDGEPRTDIKKTRRVPSEDYVRDDEDE